MKKNKDQFFTSADGGNLWYFSKGTICGIWVGGRLNRAPNSYAKPDIACGKTVSVRMGDEPTHGIPDEIRFHKEATYPVSEKNIIRKGCSLNETGEGFKDYIASELEVNEHKSENASVGLESLPATAGTLNKNGEPCAPSLQEYCDGCKKSLPLQESLCGNCATQRFEDGKESAGQESLPTTTGTQNIETREHCKIPSLQEAVCGCQGVTHGFEGDGPRHSKISPLLESLFGCQGATLGFEGGDEHPEMAQAGGQPRLNGNSQSENMSRTSVLPRKADRHPSIHPSIY